MPEEELKLKENETVRQLDKIDGQLLSLFLKRMALSEERAADGEGRGLPVEDKLREREILSKISENSGALEPYARHFFTMLFHLSGARRKEVKSGPSKVGKQIEKALSAGGAVFPRGGTVACQGVEGANSQAACDKLFTRGSIVYVKTFEAVFDAVESGLCQYGVLPVENSSSGSVRSTYTLLQQKSFSVVRSTTLRLRHELLAKPATKLADIREIYSHEQAISQCSKFLSALKDVKVIPCGNTALAAKLVSESEDPGIAAISSHSCAGLYGLNVVADSVQDCENNYTRFLCIAKEPKIFDGADKISIILTCENSPGALYEILSRPAALGINMSKLESCPISGKNFEFVFFIDLDASVREPGVKAMLEDLERGSETFNFLGNYEEV